MAKKVTVAGTARPDWMIAAELAERLDRLDVADQLSSVEAITDEIAATVPGLRRGDPRRAARPAATACWPSSAEPSALAGHDVAGAGPHQLRLPPGAVSAQAVRPGGGDGLVAVARTAAVSGSAHLHPLDIDRLGVAAGEEVRIVGDRGTVVLPVMRRRRVPAGVAAGAVQRPRDVSGRIVDATAPVTDVRIERM